MLELPLIFTAGILGSSHCIGMCGPFALSIGSGSKSWSRNLLRQVVYTLGRIFTYAVFGAVAGYAGWRLLHSVIWLQNSASLLSIAAGLFLIYQGVVTGGWLGGQKAKTGAPCFAGSFLATFLRSPRWTHTFLAGVFTGMLPCGLVYGFVAMAAGTGNLFTGALLMISFGLGTAPVMMLTGLGASFFGVKQRFQLLRIASICVVITGVVAIARGVGHLEISGWIEPAGCPACSSME